jgi:Spy/CpxP family protein refolding chaperone
MKNRLQGRTARSILLSAALFLVAFAAAPSASAQGGGRNMDPAARAQQRVELLTQRIKITPQQGEQIKAILLKQYADTRALREKNQGGDMASLRPQMQALREASDKKIDAVLTADQKAGYKALVAEEVARRGQGRGAGNR